MGDYRLWLLLAALLAVAATLALGLLNFNREGPEARRRSNRLMRWRVGLQLLVVIIILLIATQLAP